jgi:hypothetical protein
MWILGDSIYDMLNWYANPLAAGLVPAAPYPSKH